MSKLYAYACTPFERLSPLEERIADRHKIKRIIHSPCQVLSPEEKVKPLEIQRHIRTKQHIRGLGQGIGLIPPHPSSATQISSQIQIPHNIRAQTKSIGSAYENSKFRRVGNPVAAVVIVTVVIKDKSGICITR